MKKIIIVDLGTGNLRSVSKAVAYTCPDDYIVTTAEPSEILGADYLILPGQGAIGTWFRQLNSDPELNSAVVNRLRQGPVLGICLGLQTLFEYSEENQGTQGLGFLKGRVKHFSNSEFHQSINGRRYKIPHMGWNKISIINDHPLWKDIESDERFYFVHSYYADSDNNSEIAAECNYGNTFTAAAFYQNIFATQFHPEKSQRSGLKLLKNFTNWNGII